MRAANGVFIGFAVYLIALAAILLTTRAHFWYWNTGMVALVGWSLFVLLHGAVDAVAASHSGEEWLQTFCEFSVQLTRAAVIGVPSATLALNRRMLIILRTPYAEQTTDAEILLHRLRILRDDILICALPILPYTMVLSALSASSRQPSFAFVPSGCFPSYPNNAGTYLFVFVPPICIGIASVVYASHAGILAYRTKAENIFRTQPKTGLSIGRALRQTILANASLIIFNLPSVFLSIASTVRPHISAAAAEYARWTQGFLFCAVAIVVLCIGRWENECLRWRMHELKDAYTWVETFCEILYVTYGPPRRGPPRVILPENQAAAAAAAEAEADRIRAREREGYVEPEAEPAKGFQKHWKVLQHNWSVSTAKIAAVFAGLRRRVAKALGSANAQLVGDEERDIEMQEPLVTTYSAPRFPMAAHYSTIRPLTQDMAAPASWIPESIDHDVTLLSTEGMRVPFVAADKENIDPQARKARKIACRDSSGRFVVDGARSSPFSSRNGAGASTDNWGM